jgi:hypothetical protein
MARFGPSGKALAVASLTLAVALVSGCSSGGGLLSSSSPGTARSTATPAGLLATPAPTDAPTEAPTPEPTPVITPAPGFATPEELAAVCAGTPIPLAAKYAGAHHPVVLIDNSDPAYAHLDASYTTNSVYLDDPFNTEIQLVLCVGKPVYVKFGASCGTYKRVSDGKIGNVYRYKHQTTITVRVAQTGKKLTARTLYGSVATCGQQVMITSAPPPWGIYGAAVTPEQIDAYGKSVAK